MNIKKPALHKIKSVQSIPSINGTNFKQGLETPCSKRDMRLRFWYYKLHKELIILTLSDWVLRNRLSIRELDGSLMSILTQSGWSAGGSSGISTLHCSFNFSLS